MALNYQKKPVKGIAWSACNRYLASQSDDRNLLIWSTSSWSIIRKIDDPFVDSATTFVLRPSWHPESLKLCAVNSLNEGIPSATFVDAPDWKFETDVLGHRSSVTVAVK